MSKIRRLTSGFPSDWGGGKKVCAFLSACAEGCYKHYKNGKWVCCKCGC
jgi:hypothetical protein